MLFRSGEHQVIYDNYKENIRDMRALAYEITDKLIKPYEDRIKVDIYDN